MVRCPIFLPQATIKATIFLHKCFPWWRIIRSRQCISAASNSAWQFCPVYASQFDACSVTQTIQLASSQGSSGLGTPLDKKVALVESRTQKQMAGRQHQAVNPSQSRIPTFVTDDLPRKSSQHSTEHSNHGLSYANHANVVERYFQNTNDACFCHYFDDPQGFLIQFRDIFNPADGTSVPLGDITTTIFEGWQINRGLLSAGEISTELH